MTKEQIITFLANRRKDKLLAAVEWSDLVAASQNLTAQQKDDLAKGVAIGNYNSMTLLKDAIQLNAVTTATAEATAAMADDNLTITELDSLL